MVMGDNYAKAVKRLWRGRCTITVCERVTDESTGRTVAREVELFRDEPCRISFDTVRATEPANGAARIKQTITLFIDPDVNVPSGSKITATQNGVTGVYEQSGAPAVYTAHKEIPLGLFKGWA